MKPDVLLRIASAVAGLQFVAHTLLFVRSAPRHGAEEVAVRDAMKSHRFDFLGSQRSYWDFYYGYGLSAAFVVLIEAVLFWQLASLARSSPSAVMPMVALFLCFNIGHLILMWRYFFITPMIPDALIACCLGVVLWTAAR